jgi:hypothetical protein
MERKKPQGFLVNRVLRLDKKPLEIQNCVMSFQRDWVSFEQRKSPRRIQSVPMRKIVVEIKILGISFEWELRLHLSSPPRALGEDQLSGLMHVRVKWNVALNLMHALFFVWMRLNLVQKILNFQA